MKIKLLVSWGVLGALLATSTALLAHHGGSEYDSKNLKTIKGTVTEYYWANPHCQIFLDVKDDSGKTVNWGIETLAPAVLRRAGWNPQLLKPGEVVTLIIAPSKKGTPTGMVRKLILPDGKELTGGELGAISELKEWDRRMGHVVSLAYDAGVGFASIAATVPDALGMMIQATM